MRTGVYDLGSAPCASGGIALEESRDQTFPVRFACERVNRDLLHLEARSVGPLHVRAGESLKLDLAWPDGAYAPHESG